ncbi:hypothetical protein BN1221_03445c [Brenneria goodwinii]|uniref:Uncharacterized protein n=1 Tax=Brenneria goodwinii TaxID=1109412 RepID=A0A0G4JYF4_9GAMM|nr:hypothetical protein BN1221_03445c [Brenneria goodwinii]
MQHQYGDKPSGMIFIAGHSWAYLRISRRSSSGIAAMIGIDQSCW